MNNAIDLVAPPAGMVLNVVAGVGRMSMDSVTKGLIPFMIAQFMIKNLIRYSHRTGREVFLYRGLASPCPAGTTITIAIVGNHRKRRMCVTRILPVWTALELRDVSGNR